VTGLCTEEWQQKKQFMLTDINTLHNPQPSYNTCKHTAKTRTRDFSEIQRKKKESTLHTSIWKQTETKCC
jgi:hypothetical protein